MVPWRLTDEVICETSATLGDPKIASEEKLVRVQGIAIGILKLGNFGAAR
jgi:hypothetical protein